MLVPDFPPAAMHILERAHNQYMKEVSQPIGLSVNNYKDQSEFTWEDLKREALDLKDRGLIEIIGRPIQTVSTAITLKLTPYGRRYCEETLGFPTTIEES